MFHDAAALQFSHYIWEILILDSRMNNGRCLQVANAVKSTFQNLKISNDQIES